MSIRLRSSIHELKIYDHTGLYILDIIPIQKTLNLTLESKFNLLSVL